jgi:hypothetical protein
LLATQTAVAPINLSSAQKEKRWGGKALWNGSDALWQAVATPEDRSLRG